MFVVLTISFPVSFSFQSNIFLEIFPLAISRSDLKQWCSEHDYELLELEKTATSENDDEQDEQDEDQREKRKKKSKQRKR